MGLHEGLNQPRRLSPPDGKRQHHRIILRHVFNRRGQSGAAGFIVHFLIGAAVRVIVVEVGIGVGNGRLNAEQVGVEVRGRVFRQRPGIARR